MHTNWTAIVLAAGQGKRMKSTLPKVLHPLAGRPLVRYVVDAAREAGIERCAVVVGHGEAEVRAALGDTVAFVRQAEQLGTGHALAQAREAASSAEHLLVLNGDVPLLTPEVLQDLMRRHIEEKADITFLTALVDDPSGYGVVRRDGGRQVTAIVEAAERDGADGAAEINAGIYCFRADWVWPRLDRIPRARNGEYYLTELASMAVRESAKLLAVAAAGADEARGINDRAQLAEAERVIRDRIRRRHMLAGVTLMDTATAYIDADAEIGPDTTILPNTMIAGATRIGGGCEIGPNAIIRSSTIGSNCRVIASMIEGSVLEDGVDVGPYSRLRANAHICEGVHIGNFAEVKGSRLGRNTKMGHFSYIGDAEVGDGVNIGAGAITCNFDGARKNRTVIGDGAFIGSDTMLVAPVSVGAGARTGAGSVVNHDVPPGATAVGAPARVVRTRPAVREGETI